MFQAIVNYLLNFLFDFVNLINNQESSDVDKKSLKNFSEDKSINFWVILIGVDQRFEI